MNAVVIRHADLNNGSRLRHSLLQKSRQVGVVRNLLVPEVPRIGQRCRVRLRALEAFGKTAQQKRLHLPSGHLGAGDGHVEQSDGQVFEAERKRG